MEITYDDWEDRFEPIPYGKDELLIYDEITSVLQAAHRDRRLWTLVESGADDTCLIIEGKHFVNRIGYLITRLPYESGIMLNIPLPIATA